MWSAYGRRGRVVTVIRANDQKIRLKKINEKGKLFKLPPLEKEYVRKTGEDLNNSIMMNSMSFAL